MRATIETLKLYHVFHKEETRKYPR